MELFGIGAGNLSANTIGASSASGLPSCLSFCTGGVSITAVSVGSVRTGAFASGPSGGQSSSSENEDDSKSGTVKPLLTTPPRRDRPPYSDQTTCPRFNLL